MAAPAAPRATFARVRAAASVCPSRASDRSAPAKPATPVIPRSVAAVAASTSREVPSTPCPSAWATSAVAESPLARAWAPWESGVTARSRTVERPEASAWAPVPAA